MARSQFKGRLGHRFAFRNRDQALSTIVGQINASSDAHGVLRVIAITGLGGTGKSSLLSEVARRVGNANEDISVVRITLESESAGSIVAPLKAIRDRLAMQCLLFDCALVRYWFASGQPFQVVDGGGLSQSIVAKSVEAGAGVFGVPLPVEFAIDLYDSIKRRLSRYQYYAREEFEEIDELRDSPADILQRLPHYLGLDIERRASRGNQQVAFLYDAYEKQSRTTLQSNSPWLREFIGTVNCGVHVIASRERLQWPRDDWGDVIQHIVIGALPEIDARDLIASEVGASSELVDTVLSVSHGIPFYIEACINAYRIAYEEAGGRIAPAHFPATQKEAVSRLLDHLNRDERNIVFALAVVQYFDRSLFVAVIRQLNIPLPFDVFDELVNVFFVERSDGLHGLFKIHDILTDFARGSAELGSKRADVVVGAASSLSLRTAEQPEALLRLFSGVLRAADSIDTPPIAATELLIDTGYALYDAGMWRELGALDTHDETVSMRTGERIGRLFSAISHRRTKQISLAHDQLSGLMAVKDLFGRHSSSIDLESAYLSELEGNYAEAREIISGLYGRLPPNEKHTRPYVKAIQYYADLLIIDGRFRKGSDILVEAIEELEGMDSLSRIELMRHRAHAFRFSLLWDDAERLYERALSQVVGSVSMEAKLIGNLAETRCWSYPEQAVRDAGIAVSLNTRIGNQIEIGKNYCAMAISLAALGEKRSAVSHVAMSGQVFEQVGYKA